MNEGINQVLVVAAHADDEALGCGGTLARHAAEGNSVYVIFLTNGVSSRVGSCSHAVERRKHAANAALAALGANLYQSFDFPDNALDTVPRLEIIRAVESAIVALRPQIVYTHHPGDLNVDHRRAFEAVMTACRPQPEHSVQSIFAFEVASSTGWSGHSCKPFIPQHYVDISLFLEEKIAALQAYQEEMRPSPHARSIEAVQTLAKYRGSQVGLVAAEAFTVERSIVPQPRV